MKYFVDMQGFKQPDNDFILKELAIAPLSNEEPIVITFKQPYSWRRLPSMYKKENIWLSCKYHGLSWSSGIHPYTEVGSIIRSALKSADGIFVQDSIRKEWLERFNISSVKEIAFSNEKRLVTVCSNHDGRYITRCALHNVKLMREAYIKAMKS